MKWLSLILSLLWLSMWIAISVGVLNPLHPWSADLAFAKALAWWVLTRVEFLQDEINHTRR